jgi:hypothetical protein
MGGWDGLVLADLEQLGEGRPQPERVHLDLVPGDARRHPPVVRVHDLDHDQVLQDVHAHLARPAARMSASVVP